MGKSEGDQLLSDYDNINFNLSTKFIWLFFGAVLTFVLAISAFSYIKKVEPDIKASALLSIITPIVAGGIVITTLIYHSLNYHLNHQLNNLKIKQDRKAFSINLISEFHKKEMIFSTHITIGYFRDNNSMNTKALSEEIQNNQEARECATMILNYYEKVALSVDLGVADEKILRDFFKGIFNRQHNILKDYIDAKRRKDSDNHEFIRFEKTAQRWNTDIS